MSVTTGTGAKKTAGTDNWRTIIGVHNDTVDVYDEVKAAAAIFASAYDSTATYAAGDQCTHDGKWYVANQAISTAEDWTPAHWTEITIASKLDTANVYNGLDKTASGFALDARQGKSLNEAIANIQDGLAIVANGNTHAAIGAGQFVYVKGHGTLADGLYTNTSGSTIAANATLSSSNLTADASGGLNSLKSKISTLLYSEIINCTPSANLSAGGYGYFEVPVTYAKGKNIIATNISLGHPGMAGGYSLTGHYLNTLNVLYVGYYTPRAIGASNADFTVEIIYTSEPITSNSHSESV